MEITIFISESSVWVYFISFILCWVFPPSSWNMEYSHNNLKILLYVNSIICILQVSFDDFWLIFLLILTCIFLHIILCIFLVLFCMPGTFCWDAKHFEFYFVGCWIFLYSCKYSWALFWNAVKLLGNSIVGEQNSLPRMSLWHVNCFEQKQSRPKRLRKKFWPLPELPKNFYIKGLFLDESHHQRSLQKTWARMVGKTEGRA